MMVQSDQIELHSNYMIKEILSQVLNFVLLSAVFMHTSTTTTTSSYLEHHYNQISQLLPH